MLDLAGFQNLSLCGGFLLVEVQLTGGPLLDPLERAAAAQTIIRGSRFHILVRADLDEREISISLYHEILEAAVLATEFPPARLREFNEGDFENAAHDAYQRWGNASPERLNQMLAEFGFSG